MNKLENWSFKDNRINLLDNTIVNENPPDVYGYGHRAYYEHVVKCILEGNENLISGEEGKKSVKLVNAMYESAEKKKKIILSESEGSYRFGKDI